MKNKFSDALREALSRILENPDDLSSSLGAYAELGPDYPYAEEIAATDERIYLSLATHKIQ